MKKALITDGVHEVLLNDLKAANYECIYLPKIEQEEVEKIISDIEVLIVNSKINVNKAFIDKATQLKFIGRLGSGMEIIDIDYASSKGIKVYNSPEGNRDAVAEHAIGMLLMLFNNLNQAHQDVLNFNWDREARRGEELMGKTVGLIGYGNTGKAMAKKLSGFDVNVIFYDKYLNDASDKYAEQVSLQKLQTESDIISFHLPYNESTHYFFNSTFAKHMKKPYYLINTSRGKIVNMKELIVELKGEQILGVCLDVFENEKVSAYSEAEKQLYSELFSLGKSVLSPHVAGWTHQSKHKLAKILSNKILGNY